MRWGQAEATAFLVAQGFGPGPFTLQPMAGGMWNDAFRVDLPGRCLTLKHYNDVLPGSLFPNLPEAEARALQRLAGLNVAPDLIGLWPQDNVLIYPFVPGVGWTADVAAVAALLRRKEAADPAGFRALALTPEAVLAEADRLFARCRTDEPVRLWRAARPDPVAMAPPARLSLIHTDIGAGNLIGAGDGLRLIDWQCPGAGDLAEDVFSFLSPAVQVLGHRPPLSASQRAAFFQALRMPQVQARHQAMAPYFAYRIAAYGCLRMQTAAAPALRRLYRQAVLAERAQAGAAV